RELADWIRQEAVQALTRGTAVWLYATPERELVGYGSLGKTSWRWPDPNSPKVAINIIPAVAIQKPFWGKPEGPREARQSSLLLAQLVAEATERTETLPLLGLFVLPENHRAVKLYERAGFAPFSHTYTDKATGVVYRSMIYELRRQGSETPSA